LNKILARSEQARGHRQTFPGHDEAGKKIAGFAFQEKGGRRMKEMDRQDWLLLVIKHAGYGGLTPGQLQKVLFLFGQRREKVVGTRFYHFVPNNWGPFSEEIYSDAEFLQACGLADMGRPSGRTYETYFITPSGLAQAKRLEKTLTPETREYVMTLVGNCAELKF
jgi:hypothetical protein